MIVLATSPLALAAANEGGTDQGAHGAAGPSVIKPLPITTMDGKQGQVTAKTTNGKPVYFLTLGGKPAAPGTYACANGQHIKVTGPDGLVDPLSFSWGAKIMLNPQPLPP